MDLRSYGPVSVSRPRRPPIGEITGLTDEAEVISNELAGPGLRRYRARFDRGSWAKRRWITFVFQSDAEIEAASTLKGEQIVGDLDRAAD